MDKKTLFPEEITRGYYELPMLPEFECKRGTVDTKQQMTLSKGSEEVSKEIQKKENTDKEAIYVENSDFTTKPSFGQNACGNKRIIGRPKLPTLFELDQIKKRSGCFLQRTGRSVILIALNKANRDFARAQGRGTKSILGK